MEGKNSFISSVFIIVFQLLNPTAYEAYDKEIENMLDKFEWVFLPVSNVDGFSFAHEVGRTNIKRLCIDEMKI